MPNRLYVCVRSEETGTLSQRFADLLVHHFGVTNVVGVGAAGPPTLDALSRCGAVVVPMEAGWLEATDATGRQRLENPADPVRAAVMAGALQDKLVLPVLLGATVMPEPEALPVRSGFSPTEMPCRCPTVRDSPAAWSARHAPSTCS